MYHTAMRVYQCGQEVKFDKGVSPALTGGQMFMVRGFPLYT